MAHNSGLKLFLKESHNHRLQLEQALVSVQRDTNYARAQIQILGANSKDFFKTSKTFVGSNPTQGTFSFINLTLNGLFQWLISNIKSI